MKSRATLPNLNYDNCKDCASKCEHAGKNREFVYSGERSCKVNGIARKIDREKWEPCEHCKPSKNALDRWGPHQFPIDDGAIYYYDVDDGWEGEEINFCPWCGRPLTEEAWAELERRVCGG